MQIYTFAQRSTYPACMKDPRAPKENFEISFDVVCNDIFLYVIMNIRGPVGGYFII